MKYNIIRYWYILVIGFISLQFSFANNVELTLDIERRVGKYPTVAHYDNYHFFATNPFTADSGTGNTHTNTLNLILSSDTETIDSLSIISDNDFLKFKTKSGSSGSNQVPDYTTNAILYNISNTINNKLEIQFCPSKDMLPGYYQVNMKFSSIELNDSGFINLEIPIILFYNPAEWYVLGKKPGIELFLFSTRSDTNNIIFGTGYKSTSRDDTLYGEDLYDWHLLDGESRFRYNKYPLDFFDISPNDENRYSRSRDIKPVVDDTVPVIFQVVFLDSVKYYPIKLEYETYNFDPTGTYLLLESFEQDSKFNINMRDINILSNGRHQFIIDDTTIKTFYITYYKRRLSYVNNLSYTTEGFIIQQFNKIILKNFKHSDRIEIFNILGKKVFENDFDEQIDISDLQKGVYFINTGFEFVTFIKL